MSETKTYLSNPDGTIRKVIQRTTETPVDLAEIIKRYKRLENDYVSLPDLKQTPDEETLAFYNMFYEMDREMGLTRIKYHAERLLEDVEGIKVKGLLPDQYLPLYDKLKSFVNNQ